MGEGDGDFLAKGRLNAEVRKQYQTVQTSSAIHRKVCRARVMASRGVKMILPSRFEGQTVPTATVM